MQRHGTDTILELLIDGTAVLFLRLVGALLNVRKLLLSKIPFIWHIGVALCE